MKKNFKGIKDLENNIIVVPLEVAKDLDDELEGYDSWWKGDPSSPEGQWYEPAVPLEVDVSKKIIYRYGGPLTGIRHLAQGWTLDCDASKEVPLIRD